MTLIDLWPRFQGHDYSTSNNSKMVQHRAILQWPTNRKSYMIYRTAPFSMTLNDPYPLFQGHSIFDAKYLRNGTRYRHSFNGILIGTNTRPTQQCRFEWSWVTLSDLAKYSMTRSVARSLCDSWASCFILHTHSTPPLRGNPSVFCHNVSSGKTRMVGYEKVKKSLKICSLVTSQ